MARTIDIDLNEINSYSGEQFIKKVYIELLGREPDEPGRIYYLRRLGSGISKTAIISQIYASPECKNRGIRVPGLDELLKAERLGGMPIVGRLFRSGKKGNNDLQMPGDDAVLNSKSPPTKRVNQFNVGQFNDLDKSSAMKSNIVCIIPYYNGSAFIERALDSLLVQTVPADEIIVVNDGSKPAERDFLDTIKDRYPIKIVDKTNGGQGSARNAGVAASVSRYICFLDQDDFYLPKHNEILLGGIPQDDPNFGWVYADLVEANGDGSVMRTSMVKDHSTHPKRSFIDLIGNDMFILPTASLINRPAYESVGGFDEQFTGYEDDDLFLRLFRKGWSNTFVDRAVSVWCIHSESTSYSVRMSRSRFRYLSKLVVDYPDDPEKVRFYFRDLFVPRFGSLIIKDAIAASESNSKDKAEIYEILRAYSRLVDANAGMPERGKRKVKKILFYLTTFPKWGAKLARGVK